jgi:hypothetical protein
MELALYLLDEHTASLRVKLTHLSYVSGEVSFSNEFCEHGLIKG